MIWRDNNDNSGNWRWWKLYAISFPRAEFKFMTQTKKSSGMSQLPCPQHVVLAAKSYNKISCPYVSYCHVTSVHVRLDKYQVDKNNHSMLNFASVHTKFSTLPAGMSSSLLLNVFTHISFVSQVSLYCISYKTYKSKRIFGLYPSSGVQ